MEELSLQAAPSTAAFYILITSHNKTGGNQARAGGGEAINSDSGRRRGGGDRRGWREKFSFSDFFLVFGFDLRLNAHRVSNGIEIMESVQSPGKED